MFSELTASEGPPVGTQNTRTKPLFRREPGRFSPYGRKRREHTRGVGGRPPARLTPRPWTSEGTNMPRGHPERLEPISRTCSTSWNLPSQLRTPSPCRTIMNLGSPTSLPTGVLGLTGVVERRGGLEMTKYDLGHLCGACIRKVHVIVEDLHRSRQSCCEIDAFYTA